ncbi:hypothetical protein [uncultured Duncaniella sp.]|uniref:hypothetical protein n=1 Tax=uncultured Duncaniella sp. TaxID=2768039 RepID=UPI002658FDF7|nr:hypothetical protein [uncultured Duncaniella sp.]
MKGLFKLEIDLFYAALYGLFIADTEHVECLKKYKVNVNFGEVGGKYNYVCGPIEDDDITLVTTAEDVIKMVQDNNLEFGFNPLEEAYGGGLDSLPETDEFDWEDCSVSYVVEYILTGKIPE